ncbi:unnamed protein product [Notodromas monacha]|uniref:Uncharacterized protein n=1 Tax=Notodromas monacha TaxID=399045 RepID=A0A7R9GAF7_9CRUS|nr:unnamed protein product [Notodromas monacha]CAG0913940.1 unnamed protein product [Notodromas monacha]
MDTVLVIMDSACEKALFDHRKENLGASRMRQRLNGRIKPQDNIKLIRCVGQVKMISSANRPDTVDPALLRPGQLDRNI